MNSKPLTLTLITALAASLAFAPVAMAGHNHHGSHHKQGYKKQHHKHYKVKHRRHSHKHHHKASHVIGGIIGGVVLSNILHNNHHNVSAHVGYNVPRVRHTNYRYNDYNQPVVVNKTIVVNNTPTQTYRVLNGSDCYLVNHNSNGSEILTQVPNVNCGF